MIDSTKYIILKQELNVLKNKIKELNEIYEELTTEIKSTLLINEEIIDKDELGSILNTNNIIIKEIDEVLMPIINSNS